MPLPDAPGTCTFTVYKTLPKPQPSIDFTAPDDTGSGGPHPVLGGPQPVRLVCAGCGRSWSNPKTRRHHYRSSETAHRFAADSPSPVSGSVLASMSEESRRALDGRDRSEYLRDQRRIVRTPFKIAEAPLHAIEPFLALDQKLACQFVHRAYKRREELASAGENLR